MEGLRTVLICAQLVLFCFVIGFSAYGWTDRPDLSSLFLVYLLDGVFGAGSALYVIYYRCYLTDDIRSSVLATSTVSALVSCLAFGLSCKGLADVVDYLQNHCYYASDCIGSKILLTDYVFILVTTVTQLIFAAYLHLADNAPVDARNAIALLPSSKDPAIIAQVSVPIVSDPRFRVNEVTLNVEFK